ncbi:MAG: glycosyltransferase family 2 protein, partial [bacterium]|nr:glycosyltransferase family 2 protein [bacterium]
MKPQTITAVIPARNEEKNIERCIKSLLWCDKIQVLWMGTDETGRLAKSLGAEVIEMKKTEKDNFIEVQKNVNWAIDHCTTDWILRVDADEEVTIQLQQEIKELLGTGVRVAAYGIPRRQYFAGGFLRGGDWVYDRLVRLFKPKYARYDPIVSVHEQFKVNGEIDYLKNPLNHYSHPTLQDALRKFDVYTTAESKDLHETTLSALMKLIFLPPYIFLRWMIWHKGYKDG